MKVGGQWRYVYRAVDQFGQVGSTAMRPAEVTTDKAPTYLRELDKLAPPAGHRTERYANNRVEADHGQLKRRLRPMRDLKTRGDLRLRLDRLVNGHVLLAGKDALHRGELGVLPGDWRGVVNPAAPFMAAIAPEAVPSLAAWTPMILFRPRAVMACSISS